MYFSCLAVPSYSSNRLKQDKRANIFQLLPEIQQLQKTNNLHLAKNDHHKKDKKNSSSTKIYKTEYDEKNVIPKPILPSCIDVSRVNGQPWKMRGDRKLNTMLKGNK